MPTPHPTSRLRPPDRGDRAVPQQTIEQLAKRVYDMGVPLNLHANGARKPPCNAVLRSRLVFLDRSEVR
jgi:hypothetical protein